MFVCETHNKKSDEYNERTFIGRLQVAVSSCLHGGSSLFWLNLLLERHFFVTSVVCFLLDGVKWTLNLSLDLHGVATWRCGGIIFITRQKQWRQSNAERLLCSIFITWILDDLINSHFLPASPRLSWLLMIVRKKNIAELIKSTLCLSPPTLQIMHILFCNTKKNKNAANKCHRQYRCI